MKDDGAIAIVYGANKGNCEPEKDACACEVDVEGGGILKVDELQVWDGLCLSDGLIGGLVVADSAPHVLLCRVAINAVPVGRHVELLKHVLLHKVLELEDGFNKEIAHTVVGLVLQQLANPRPSLAVCVCGVKHRDAAVLQMEKVQCCEQRVHGQLFPPVHSSRVVFAEPV